MASSNDGAVPAQAVFSSHHFLVTGGTGFVGSHIVAALVGQHPEARLSVLDNNLPPAWIPPRADVTFSRCDIANPDEVVRTLQAVRPTLIVHTAGVVPNGNDRYDRGGRRSESVDWKCTRINVQGTKSLVDAARLLGIRYFVYTGSVTCVTDNQDYRAAGLPNWDESTPVEPDRCLVYGRSKGRAEKYVLAANDPPRFYSCSIRPSVLFGPGDRNLVPTLRSLIGTGQTAFRIGLGDNLYDFGYVANIADAHVLAVENLLSSEPTAAGEAFNVSNGEPVPFRDFAKAVWAQFGHVDRWEFWIPIPLAMFAGWLADWLCRILGLTEDITLSRGAVLDYTVTAYANIEKSRAILGYRPRVGLVEGVKTSCQVCRVCSPKAWLCC